MKKIFVFVSILIAGNSVTAQPWFHPANGEAPKLDAVIKAYENSPLHNEEEEEETHEKGKVVKEGRNYQFERWLWYWKNHTDENGYMVPPIRTYNEWNNYLSHQKRSIVNARTTSIPSNWTFQGPDHSDGGYHGLGRVNTVAFHPSDPRTFWVGSAGGGAWRTTDSGSTWTSMTSSLPVLGISDIDFNPLNPNTIYLCTGDGEGGNTYSLGVFKSTDGGSTWNPTGLQWNSSNFYNAYCLVINRIDTNTLLLASSQGIFRSLDAGSTWANVKSGNFKQILYNPLDTNILYATTYDPANIYRSADGGTTWTAVTSNGSSIDRIAMAVTPAAPNIVKAVFANYQFGLDGIYSSSDSGLTFTKIFDGSDCNNNILNGDLTLSSSSCGGQGWYDLCIAMRTVDSNNIVVGGVNTWQSLDGGYSWNMVTQWYDGLSNVTTVHADKHFLGFNPQATNILFEGSDGGIHMTADPSHDWVDVTNGLGITQFYRNAVSNQASFVLGGAQDNGSKLIVSPVSTELTGGDGMQCQIDPYDSNVMYTAVQYGDLSISTDGGVNFNNISNVIPGQPQGAWVTPYALLPSDPQVIIAGYDKVYLSTSRGSSWDAISPVFVNNSTIDRIGLAITNQNYIYALVDNRVHYTTDLGVNWHTAPLPFGGTISDILVDPKNENTVWVTFSGYSSTKVAKFSVNTNSWAQANGQLPNIPINCIQIDSSTGTQYLGTETGVFYRDTTMTNWALFNNGLPNVVVNDLNINYTTKEIWAATFGRGMWKSPKADTATTAVNVRSVQTTQNNIIISPNPGNGHFKIHTSDRALFNKAASLRLLASNARVVWSGAGDFNSNGDIEINASSVDRGIYMLEIKTASSIIHSRVVILK